jgi:hypothetical protein
MPKRRVTNRCNRNTPTNGLCRHYWLGHIIGRITFFYPAATHCIPYRPGKSVAVNKLNDAGSNVTI